MWFVTRRRYLRDLAAERAETRRVKQVKDDFWQQRDEAMAAARTAARQFAEADATNRRLAGRVEELGKRVSALTESDPEYLADLEQQLAAEKRRADRLQARLDDAVGMPEGGPIADSGPWQPAARAPKPGVKP
ncbi:hypothetical protein ACFCWT_13295 [Streptomyces olivaceus]|uniref:hypothetical protein n=1 Tax=Streptomyces olivaceus TaxID=47716 RepID=UPI0035D5AB75